MAKISQLTPRLESTEESALLRALSESSPAGTRWQAGFAHLRQTMLTDQHFTSLLPGVLRLAIAQHSCRLHYLNLLETLCSGPAAQHAGLAQAIRDVEPQLCQWLSTDPQPQTRAAAARLIAAAGGPGRADVLNHRLRREEDPAVAAAILGALHPLHMAAADPLWRYALAQFQTEVNPAPVRFQAACCSLQADHAALPALLAILKQYLYCPHERTAADSIRVIALYAALLPREQGVGLWAGLLAAAAEFDGAAGIACHLLRAACNDRREGWAIVRLSSVRSPGARSATVSFRRVWAHAYWRLTGRFPRLPLAPGELPAREYPEVKAFPPRVDPADPCHLAALSALANCEPLWLGHTELWRHFGLPPDRTALRALCESAGRG